MKDFLKSASPILRHWPGFLGLFLIGVYSLGSALFYRQFAHLHLQLSWLNFPIFISEMLILVGGVLFIVMVKRGEISLTKWHGWIVLYVCWVLIKAALGYQQYGPLAFRNSALLYYPAIGVMGFHFYRHEFFSPQLSRWLLGVLLFSKFLFTLSAYSVFPYLCIALVLLFKSNVRNKFLFIGLLLLIVYTPPRMFDCQNFTTLDFFFYTSRNRVIGHIMAFTFLFSVIFLWFVSIKKRFKTFILTLIFVLILIGVAKYADPNAVKSMTDITKVIEGYHGYSELIAEQKPYFVPESLSASLYSPEEIEFDGLLRKSLRRYDIAGKKNEEEVVLVLKKAYEDILSDQVTKADVLKAQLKDKLNIDLQYLVNDFRKPKSKAVTIEDIASIFQIDENGFTVDGAHLQLLIPESKQVEVLHRIENLRNKYLEDLSQIDRNKHANIAGGVKEVIKSIGRDDEITVDEVEAIAIAVEKKPRDLDTAFNNIYFRLFIWRDMLVEVIKEKAWMGVSFGKPQRSESIEILGWASTEWRRDGWITPHNSFLHIIYRGGIVGVAFLIGLVSLLVYLIRGFIRLKCLPGIFLMTIFVYWMTIANFLVFLEFPYNAVHFWGLLGMTLAFYRDQLKAAEARV